MKSIFIFLFFLNFSMFCYSQNIECDDASSLTEKEALRCFGKPDKVITFKDYRGIFFKLLYYKLENSINEQFKYRLYTVDVQKNKICEEAVVKSDKISSRLYVPCYECEDEFGNDICI